MLQYYVWVRYLLYTQNNSVDAATHLRGVFLGNSKRQGAWSHIDVGTFTNWREDCECLNQSCGIAFHDGPTLTFGYIKELAQNLPMPRNYRHSSTELIVLYSLSRSRLNSL